MRQHILKLIRRLAIALAILMFVVSGHFWNVDKVYGPTLYAFDLIITLLAIFVVAILMQDASEKRQNINTILLLIGAGLSVAFILP